MTNVLDDIQIKELLNALDTAIIVTDFKGSQLYANDQYRTDEAEIMEYWDTVAQNIHEASSMKKKVVRNIDSFIIMSMPINTGENSVILTHLSDVAHIVALKKKLDDSEKRSEAYSRKLSKITLQDYIANSDSMIRVFEKAYQIASYPTTVLLVGETGVGKEVVTSFIHKNSNRAEQPLIKVNCSAIPEQLLESELFGYESGAFTGAKTKGKPGLFELANNGTILLDEIGDMNIMLQAKLLRVLQENEIMRLGGQKSIPINVRVISSTNRDLKKMMEEGEFSDALYYRLNVVEIKIPSLRNRRADIIPLSIFFLRHFCEKYNLERLLSQEVKECLLKYNWPGNIRELKNMIENLVVSSLKDEIGIENLPQRMINIPITQDSLYETMSMEHNINRLQKELITKALDGNGSFRKAAAVLEMDPSTLYRLAKKLGISYQK